jgi:hypothetical protein
MGPRRVRTPEMRPDGSNGPAPGSLMVPSSASLANRARRGLWRAGRQGRLSKPRNARSARTMVHGIESPPAEKGPPGNLAAQVAGRAQDRVTLAPSDSSPARIIPPRRHKKGRPFSEAGPSVLSKLRGLAPRGCSGQRAARSVNSPLRWCGRLRGPWLWPARAPPLDRSCYPEALQQTRQMHPPHVMECRRLHPRISPPRFVRGRSGSLAGMRRRTHLSTAMTIVITRAPKRRPPSSAKSAPTLPATIVTARKPGPDRSPNSPRFPTPMQRRGHTSPG